jgi:hypothetical protein
MALAMLLACGLPAFASAAGPLKLRWDACWGDGGVANKAFTCDVNTGSNVLVASLVPNFPTYGVTDIASRVDITVDGGSVPDWWRFRTTGSCRVTSLNAAVAPPLTAVACQDWSNGTVPPAFLTYTLDTFVLNTAHVQIVSILPAGLTADFITNGEYYLYSLTLNHVKTVGTGACAGCTLGACIGLQSVRLNVPPPGLSAGFSAFVLDSDWNTTWQGGIFNNSGALNCSLTTPTRNSTWSSVKALYR